MAITYKNLWKLLIDKEMNKSDLKEKVGLSSSTIAKLGQNRIVKLDVLERICLALNCEIQDVVEVVRPNPLLTEIEAPHDVIEEPVQHSVVSLFSGCGGLDLGFRGGFTFLGKEYPRNPFEIIWSNEINKAACATYIANVDQRILEGPIEEKFSMLPNYADVIIGGFPCQDISINGKMAGVDGKRSGLYVWMVKAVQQLKPKVFVAENVKALLMKRHEQSLQRIITDFSEAGYNISYHLYDAKDYGVPQTRERVIIVGVRKDLAGVFEPPAPTTHDNPITCKEALEDLENLPADAEYSHIWSEAKKSSGQGCRFLTADAPATTMRSECHGNLQFHYRLPRRISMREAARIQSFPDDFIFHAKLRETERMIGNAVPPVFAWHIANAVLKVLEQQQPQKVEENHKSIA